MSEPLRTDGWMNDRVTESTEIPRCEERRGRGLKLLLYNFPAEPDLEHASSAADPQNPRQVYGRPSSLEAMSRRCALNCKTKRSTFSWCYGAKNCWTCLATGRLRWWFSWAENRRVYYRQRLEAFFSSAIITGHSSSTSNTAK